MLAQAGNVPLGHTLCQQRGNLPLTLLGGKGTPPGVSFHTTLYYSTLIRPDKTHWDQDLQHMSKSSYRESQCRIKDTILKGATVYSVQRGQHLIHMEQIKQVLEKNTRHRNYLLFVIRHTREFCKLGSANVHIYVRSQTASSCESEQWQFIHCQSGKLAGNFGLLMFEMVL